MGLALAARRPIRPKYEFQVGEARIRLYHGDCLDVLPTLATGSIRTVVTSPPYNIGVRYRSYRDDIPRRDYLSWTEQWLRAVSGAVSPHASLFLNVGAKPTDPWIPLEVAQVARGHFLLQNTIHWVKSIAIDQSAVGANVGLEHDVAIGHYKPINSDRFVNDCHEFIFHFTPGGRTPLDRRAIGVRYQDQSNVARWAGAGGGKRCRGNTWFIPYDTIQSRDRDRPHPASFPVRIPEQCLRLHGLARAATVLDPFLGLGSTGAAAASLGLDFVGIELDEHYLKEAADRLRLLRPASASAVSASLSHPRQP